MVATVRTARRGLGESVAGSVMGTPAYMPPEQAMGRVDELDEKSDLFSLGAVLCEILTGVPAYARGKNRMAAAAQAQLEPAYERLDKCGADSRLIKLAKHCLQPLPKDRPTGATAVADAIAAYLTSAEGRAHRAQVRALKSTAQAEQQQRARRQSLLVGVSVLTIVVAALGVWFWKDGRDTEREVNRRHAVEQALLEATRLRKARDWTGALAAAEQARDLGDDGKLALAIQKDAKRDAAKKAREAADDALLEELDAIRADIAQLTVIFPTGERFIHGLRRDEEVDAAYDAVIQKRFSSVGSCVNRLKASKHARDFAAHLGTWAWIRKARGADGWEPIDRAARKIDPRHADVIDAIMARDHSDLRDIAKDRLDLPPDLAARIALALGRAHAKDIVPFLEREIRRTPDHFQLRYVAALNAGMALRSDLMGQHATAALALRPEHPVVLHMLGMVAAQRHDWPRALRLLRRAQKSEADNPAVLVHVAIAQNMSGDATGSVKTIERVLELAPDFLAAQHTVARALIQLGDAKEAIRMLRRAIEKKPDDPQLFELLSAAYGLVGDLEASAAAAERAMDLDPRRAEGYVNMSLLALERGEYERAAELARRALSSASASRAYLNLASALLQLERVDEALEAATKAVRTRAGSRQCARYLGRCALSLRRFGRRDGSVRTRAFATAEAGRVRGLR